MIALNSLQNITLFVLLLSLTTQLTPGFVVPTVPSQITLTSSCRSITSRQTTTTSVASSRPFSSRRCGIHLFSSTKTSSKSDANKAQGKKRLATGMAFLTGCADLALFTKYKTFATMMTGNTMWMALSVLERRYRDVGYYMCVILSYIMGLIAFRKVDIKYKNKSMTICSLLVGSLFITSDVVNFLTQTRWIPVMLLAAGYGIVNSIGMEVSGTLTFVITGHMTKLTHLFSDRFLSRRKSERKKLTDNDQNLAVQNLSVIFGFFAGALFASVLHGLKLLQKFGVFAGLGVLYGSMFLWYHDMESLGGAWWKRKDGEMCELDDDGELCLLPDDNESSTADATNGSIGASADTSTETVTKK